MTNLLNIEFSTFYLKKFSQLYIESRPKLVLKLFLNFDQFDPRCSSKVVLIRRSVYSRLTTTTTVSIFRAFGPVDLHLKTLETELKTI